MPRRGSLGNATAERCSPRAVVRGRVFPIPPDAGAVAIRASGEGQAYPGPPPTSVAHKERRCLERAKQRRGRGREECPAADSSESQAVETLPAKHSPQEAARVVPPPASLQT